MDNNQNNSNQTLTILAIGVGIVGVGALVYANLDNIKDGIVETVEGNLDFQVTKVGYQLGYPFITLPIDFELINNNLIGATDVTFQGAAYYEGTKVGDILEVSIIDIPAERTIAGTVEILVDLRKMKARIIDIFSNGRFSNQIEIRGKGTSNFGAYQASRKVAIEV